MGQTVVVLEKDPAVAATLALALHPRFGVEIVSSIDGLFEQIAATPPQGVVVNLEHGTIAEVESLHREYPALPIVCTHRVPDESMWMAALEAGASDICPTSDATQLLASLILSVATSRNVAA
jgi:DNA-binding NarL/FixJ family response regulator